MSYDGYGGEYGWLIREIIWFAAERNHIDSGRHVATSLIIEIDTATLRAMSITARYAIC